MKRAHYVYTSFSWYLVVYPSLLMISYSLLGMESTRFFRYKNEVSIALKCTEYVMVSSITVAAS
jgi:hypothetical protein